MKYQLLLWFALAHEGSTQAIRRGRRTEGESPDPAEFDVGSEDWKSLFTNLAYKTMRSAAIPNHDIWKLVPPAPADYPEALQGILWMDQKGLYGWSDPRISAAPESLLSFGETKFSRWNPDTRTYVHSFSCGGAWVVDESVEGYGFTSGCSGNVANKPSILRFRFSEDMNHVDIDMGHEDVGFFQIPFGKAEMTRNYPPEGACPPLHNATREERNLCAKWIRETYPNYPNKTDPYNYPIFEIVGADGVPIEPYFSAFLDALSQKNVTHSRVGVPVPEYR